MKNKGFTLVEMLAMMVVIGVIVAVTVPNINGILNNQKYNAVEQDLTNLVNSAKTKVTNDRVISATVKTSEFTDKCYVFTLDYLDSNSDIDTGINGEEYDRDASFVAVKKEQVSGKTTLKYYVRLIEKTGTNEYYGFDFDDYDSIKDDIENNIGKVNSSNVVSLKDGNINKIKGTSCDGKTIRIFSTTE